MSEKDSASFVSLLAVVVFGLGGCASQNPSSRHAEPPGRSALSVADFAFDAAVPFAAAADLSRWRALDAATAAHEDALNACLGDPEACPSRPLARFRRLVEIAAQQDDLTQLAVVHEYFNSTAPASEGYDRSGRDVWEPLYTTAATLRGDCEDIALAKYFTLRRLGWPVEDLRVLVGWDKQERDWHAMLAVRTVDGTYVLDSILGFRRVSAFSGTRLVYSISDLGIWDHAPSNEPVSKRAARVAAVVPGD
jgi:predicted transglutaminase-like cysteine proteinase